MLKHHESAMKQSFYEALVMLELFTVGKEDREAFQQTVTPRGKAYKYSGKSSLLTW